MQHSRASAALVAIGALAALPAGAHAATKTVSLGAPSNVAGPLLKKGVESLNYFPLKTTIRVGDKVKFVVNGFHTLELKTPGAGGGPGDGPGGPKIMGALDAAGQPFWFNGQSAGGPGGGGPPGPPAFGKTVTLPSAKGFSSGFPTGPKTKPITIKFAKARTYSFFCLIHPGMNTSVKVVGRTGVVPSARADARALARQVGSVKKVANGLSKVSVPANTVSMGAEKAGTHFFGFLPGTLSVAPGTTVTFKMPTAARETHTVSFGPGNPNKEPNSYLGKLSRSIESPDTDPAAIFPSEKPGTVASLRPSLHGNGFWNSGFLDGAAVTPSGSSNKLRFDTPGTYTYYCLIHPFMSGKVKVG